MPKMYQVVIEYMEPAQAVVTLYAESPEDAINIVRHQWQDTKGEIEVKAVEELADLQGTNIEDISSNRKIN